MSNPNPWLVAAGVVGLGLLIRGMNTVKGTQTTPPGGGTGPIIMPEPQPGPAPAPATPPATADISGGGVLTIAGLRVVADTAAPMTTGWRITRGKTIAFTLPLTSIAAAAKQFTVKLVWKRSDGLTGFQWQTPQPYNLRPNIPVNLDFRALPSAAFPSPGLYQCYLRIESGTQVVVSDSLPVGNWDLQIV